MPVSPPYSSPGKTATRQGLLICLGLALLTAAAYWPVVRNGFVNYDDPDYVTSNPIVQAGLTGESIRWAFTSYHSSNWHPLTWLSHMLDCQLYGLKPAGHHLTNVAFHVANSLLLFLLLRALTGALWRSALVAALFALHPLHVESVAWVAERKDVLSTFFGLLSLWAYSKYARAVSKRATLSTPFTNRYYWLALGLLALGLMSKPMLVTLPCVLLLLDFWPLGRFHLSNWKSQIPSIRSLVWEKLPFFALSAASCVVTFWVQRASGAVVSLTHASFDVRLANALVSYVRYLARTLWPVDLAVFYPYTPLEWSSGEVVGAVLLLAAITAGVVIAARSRPYLPVGWLWFIGTLVPVIGLVQVGKQALADRYTYLPHIGLFVLCVWGAAELAGRWKWPRPGSVAVALALLGGCLFLTSRQIPHWRNSRTLFEHADAVTTNNFVAWTVIATALFDENKPDQALDYCRRALQLSPDYVEAHNTIGNIYLRQDKLAEAVVSFRAAIASDPSYGAAHHGLAAALFKQGKFAEAEAAGREALRLEPHYKPALFTLAQSLHQQQKLDQARAVYERLLGLDPNLFSVRRGLGNVLATQGKLDEAIAQFQAALKIKPAEAETRTALGIVLSDRGRLDEAAAQFTEVVRLQATNSVANYYLGLISQGRGRAADAVKHYRQALQAQPDWPEVLNNLAWILAANKDPALRDGKESVRLAERACQLTSQSQPVFIGTLAAAYAEAGRFAEAAATAEKARAAALAAGQKGVADKNAELLELYRSGRAFHETE
jgi:tetratricopeptide (TPR) repeat protein